MIFTFLTSCFFRPRFYSAKPIEAWIVDEDTGKPLKNVVVVIYWELHGGMQPHPVGQLTIMETVTDKNGRFYFPAWGPKTTFRGYLRSTQPHIIFFKSGYEWGYFSNDISRKSSLGINYIRISKWHGKSIELSKFKGNMEKYLDKLFDLRDDLDDISEYQNILDCEWKEIPIMTQAIRKEYSNFPPYLEKCPSLKLKFLD